MHVNVTFPSANYLCCSADDQQDKSCDHRVRNILLLQFVWQNTLPVLLPQTVILVVQPTQTRAVYFEPEHCANCVYIC